MQNRKNIDHPASPSASSADEVFLTEYDVAARWKISPKTLRNGRVDGGGVAFVKIGRLVRYRLGDIERYESTHTVNTAPQARR